MATEAAMPLNDPMPEGPVLGRRTAGPILGDSIRCATGDLTKPRGAEAADPKARTATHTG